MISRVMMNWLVYVYVETELGYLALPAGQTYCKSRLHGLGCDTCAYCTEIIKT